LHKKPSRFFVSPGIIGDPFSEQADHIDFQLYCLWYYLQQLTYQLDQITQTIDTIGLREAIEHMATKPPMRNEQMAAYAVEFENLEHMRY